jgi:hypothetical protein
VLQQDPSLAVALESADLMVVLHAIVFDEDVLGTAVIAAADVGRSAPDRQRGT